MEVLKSNQAAAENLLAAQESNRKIAERFFKDGMELLRTNQAAAESLVAAQEGNVKYAQRFFTDGMQILERQAESMRTLMQELERQIKRQQEALQTLAHESVDNYIDFLRTPLSYYQQTLDAAETLTRQGLEQFQKATQQMQDSVQKKNQP
jgi:signal transduction histidine kinase